MAAKRAIAGKLSKPVVKKKAQVCLLHGNWLHACDAVSNYTYDYSLPLGSSCCAM